MLGVVKNNSKGKRDTMGCLGAVIGFFIVMGAVAAFEAVFFALPLIGAVILYFNFQNIQRFQSGGKSLQLSWGRLPPCYLLLTCLTKRYIPALRLSFCLAYMVFSLHFLCRKKKDKRQYVFPSIQCRWRGYKCLLASV